MANRALLDAAAAAERLNVTQVYIRYLANKRRLPHVRLGRLLRFDPADLDAYVDQHRVPTATQGDAA